MTDDQETPEARAKLANSTDDIQVKAYLKRASVAHANLMRAVTSLPKWHDDARRPMSAGYIGGLLGELNDPPIGHRLQPAFEAYIIATAQLQAAVIRQYANRSRSR